MHEDPMPGGSPGEERATPAQDDKKWQARVLLLVLEDAGHSRLAMEDLIRKLAGEVPTFEERDQIERALFELASSGLVRVIGGLVSPTEPARAFHALELP